MDNPTIVSLTDPFVFESNTSLQLATDVLVVCIQQKMPRVCLLNHLPEWMIS